LQSSQLSPSPLSAIEDCVRGRAFNVPRRTPSQLRQLQFHCGNPPPAAEPSTRTRMRGGLSRSRWRKCRERAAGKAIPAVRRGGPP